eukprot:TRINITY_DN3797_c0_g2_i1.p1 TRINITY_DN3797_c0_g2~~TRINITY_DN3797_c0_g2_i1.p1  ORF type:complete len:622 (+),score=163.96 TRINITY_DN3797_c0_g2_i1:121-1986(+)
MANNNDNKLRIAIVNPDKCKPKKCGRECKKFCPVERMGKRCIEVSKESTIAWISEVLCNGCGICVKRCPFDAIKIINLPKALEKEITHRHGPNGFMLHRMPIPRANQVLGLVGANGTGKSTCLKTLAGKIKPNLGNTTNNPPSWQQILDYFKGSELHKYFNRLLDEKLKAGIKPQYVDSIPKVVKGIVGPILESKDERGVLKDLEVDLDLQKVLTRDVSVLSGGELQRFAIAALCIQDLSIYMFDEPSSYLDVKQRLKAARVIRNLRKENNYIIVVEHDLSVLDFLSDFVCILYGVPGAYGIVTMPYGCREGINVFLGGFIPTENMRFRDVALTFNIAEHDAQSLLVAEKHAQYKYPRMTKKMITEKDGHREEFDLIVEPGEFSDSEIIVMMGENGTGKTTFVRLLAGVLKPDVDENGELPEIPNFAVSYKPQKINPTSNMRVLDLIHKRIKEAYVHPQFTSDVIKPLKIESFLERQVQELSGGELQRLALAICLGTPADVYLIDEPSAYLDSEQRIIAARVIKRFIYHAKKTAFIVEHDFIMSTYLADKIVVYTGQPSVCGIANSPQTLLAGVNSFLKNLEVTFRRDPRSLRPRINKPDGRRDREQKAMGAYFFLDENDS